ncbi:MAG: DUF2318 domain-containing protein [Herbinix sp.]|nr:DUF2318 domain-containing protein [Herbinix sp.]
MSKKSNNKIDIKKLAIFTVVAVALVVVVFGLKNTNKSDNSDGSVTQDTAKVATVKDSDIVIQVKEVTDKPAFYAANVNGTDMEVIAVKASDGTIRTAFNTCQVCYSSGKGYYKVEGDQLVCQNCGNRFGMDDVEVTKGGCNPVPITEEYKTVNDETITVSKDVLSQAATIFQNWK